MNKGAIGKLGKLKCMLKKWQAKSQRHYHHRRLGDVDEDDADKTWQRQRDEGEGEVEEEGRQHRQQQMDLNVEDSEKVPAGMHPVYVGKSRRRYLIASHLAGHPLFQVLVKRSGAATAGSTAVVECEVVLFEHLLWMLENADPQPEALEELVDFYSCQT